MNCRLGWIIPFFGIIQFIAITFLAALSYPGGFNYLEYYLGDLGAEVAKNGEQNSISSALFSIALIIVAIALIPFWLCMNSLFKESKMEKLLSRSGLISGILSSCFIFGIVVFPIDTQLEIHIFMTLTFFSLFILATILYSIAIIMNRDFSNYFGYIGFFLLIVAFSILINPLASYAAFLQTVSIYCYFFWIIIQIFFIRNSI